MTLTFGENTVKFTLIAIATLLIGAMLYIMLFVDFNKGTISQTYNSRIPASPAKQVQKDFEGKYVSAESKDDRATSLLGWAGALATQGDYSGAIDLVDQALALNALSETSTANAMIRKAEYQAANGDYEDAVKTLREIQNAGILDDSPRDLQSTEVSDRLESYDEQQNYTNSVKNLCESEQGC